MRSYFPVKNIVFRIISTSTSLFALSFCLVLIGSVKQSESATYYVNNAGASSCQDGSGYGTLAKPYCTISYAIGRLNAGDTLYVRAGTYNENLYITGPAGTSGKNTTISAYPGDSVTLRGDSVNTGRCKIANTSYITFKGFTMTNYNQGLYVETAGNITVSKCTIHDVGQQGLTVHYGSSYVTVDSCTIHDTRKWMYNGEGIYIGTGDAAPVDNTNNVTISNTTIYNTTDEGIEFKIGTHHITADGNTIYNVNLGSDWSQNGNDVGAIEINQSIGSVQNYTSDPHQVAKNNYFHDVKTAIRAGTGCTVYNNVIRNVSGYGIYVDNQSNDSYTRLIYHNTIDAASANAVYHVGGTQDVRNNIGPSSTKNIATQNSFYVNKTGANYHLVSGAAPIDAGDDLTSFVPTDKDGVSRKTNGAPDMGAYEYAKSTQLGKSADPGSTALEFKSITIRLRGTGFSVTLHISVRSPELTIVDLCGRTVYHTALKKGNGAIYNCAWKNGPGSGMFYAIIKETFCDNRSAMTYTKFVVAR